MSWTYLESGSRVLGGPLLPSVLVASEEAENSSDKSLTIATLLGVADTEDLLEIIGIRVELSTTATVGNRQLRVALLDSASDVIHEADAHAVQAASLDKYYEFRPNISAGGTVGGIEVEPLPASLWMKPGDTLRIYDTAAVDAAADDMIVHVRALRYPR